MVIGFDAKRAFSNNSGLGNYSRFVLESLAMYQPENQYLAYTPRVTDAFSFNQTNQPKGFWQKKFAGLWRVKGISDDLRNDKVQLFHGLSNELPLGLGEIPSVVTIHDLIFLRYPELYPFFDRQIYRQKVIYACEKAKVIVAISQQTKSDLIEFLGIDEAKIRVVYQDSHKRFHQRPSEDAIASLQAKYSLQKPFVLCVGTFTERKNQNRLVEAFSLLKNQGTELILIGGRGEYQKKVEASISKSNSSVRIFNDIVSEELPTWYAAASVFAYPSLFEGFGIPIIEALHIGTPVLTSSGSCFGEAGGAGALYADALSVDSISEKLSVLLDDSMLRQQLVAAGKKHIEQFSGQIIAADLAQIYRELT